MLRKRHETCDNSRKIPINPKLKDIMAYETKKLNKIAKTQPPRLPEKVGKKEPGLDVE